LNANNSNWNGGFDNKTQFYNNQENNGSGFSRFGNDNRNNFNQGYLDNNNGWGNFQGDKNGPRGWGGRKGHQDFGSSNGYNGYY
jgi:hypothetical protein